MLFKRKVVLLKLESSYGSDASPANADALLMHNVDISPINVANKIQRDLVNRALGTQKKTLAGKHVQLTAEVELASSGTPGTAPKWKNAARICGLAETVAAAGATQASPPTPSGTPTGTFTYVAAAAYTGTIDRVVTLTCTTGGGSGVAEFTVSAPAAFGVAAVNTAGVVMTNASPFALANSATITPTVGTSFDVGDTFTIKLFAPRVSYSPVSSGFESASAYFNIDGNRHKFFGARANASLRLNAMNLPYLQFSMLGLFQPVDAAALPAADFTGWQDPIEVGDQTTPDFQLHGYDAAMSELSIDFGNRVGYRNLVNQEQVRLSDRQMSGSVSIESPVVSTKDWFGIATAHTLGALYMLHGNGAGKFIQLDAPQVQVEEPSYYDDDGTAMLRLPLGFVPLAGDDELKITVR